MGVANAVVTAHAVFTNDSCLILVFPAFTLTCSDIEDLLEELNTIVLR
jgi:hypothetical protein